MSNQEEIKRNSETPFLDFLERQSPIHDEPEMVWSDSVSDKERLRRFEQFITDYLFHDEKSISGNPEYYKDYQTVLRLARAGGLETNE